MHIVGSVNMDQDNHLAIQEPEGHHSLFAVVLPRVFSGDGEVIPDGFDLLEVQTVIFDVAAALWLVPGGNEEIVATIYLAGKYAGQTRLDGS